MHNIHYDYAKMETWQREAGLRRAQLTGEALEVRERTRFSWPWRRRSSSPSLPVESGGRAIPAN